MLRNGLEPWHLLLVAIVVILLFGSKKLPEAARGLGKSMRILKSETKAMKDDGTAQSATPAEEASTPAEAEAVRTIHADPGDTTTARPVPESHKAP